MGQARKETEAKWQGREALDGPAEPSSWSAASFYDTPARGPEVPLEYDLTVLRQALAVLVRRGREEGAGNLRRSIESLEFDAEHGDLDE